MRHLSDGQCPAQWKPKCHPHAVDPPKNPPPPPPPVVIGKTFNVIYLVDEHDVTNVQRVQRVNSDGTLPSTIRQRYAWHYPVANINTFNLYEAPDTIYLDPNIATPGTAFRWEGFMFDIPAGDKCCRACIMSGADTASDGSLTSSIIDPMTKKEIKVDRVVGFCASYDNKTAYGPIAQIRRDDQYRCLATGADSKGKKLAWHCAYYITAATPTKPTTFTGVTTVAQEPGNPDAQSADASSADALSPEELQQEYKETEMYDTLMDKNVDPSVKVGDEEWGQMLFAMDTSQLAPSKLDDTDSATDPPEPGT
ncbi:hypothetical protein EJ06DRAFT_219495 [Trichodelitschia bisporula]|uniref:Uncharacterized protein n=1 Tax=Trichodelitschia bisporula TaxID=703511 RepID=A0A6G1I9D1_9PEZI|nr:hypothetical protein EJ06DRAFT_219495 [Trichodelitschia bisporula]